MAGDSEKKRLKSNAQTIKHFGLIIGVPAALHGAVRIGVYGNVLWVWYLGTLAAAGVCYGMMYMQAAAGGDLMMKGSTSEYMQDIIYVAGATMALTIVTDWAYLLWLLVLGYISWHLAGYAWSYLFPPPAPPMTEAEKKAYLKKQRQAEQQERRSKGR